jgi:MFS family permease
MISWRGGQHLERFMASNNLAPTPTEAARPARKWRRHTLQVLGAMAMAYLGFAVVVPALPVYIRSDLGLGAGSIGLVMGIDAATTALIRPLAGAFADRYGCRLTFCLGVGILALTGAGYYLSTSIGLMITNRLLMGLGLGAALSSATIWVVEIAPETQRSWALGLVGTVNYGTLAVGVLLGQALLNLGEYALVFACAAAAPALAAAVLVHVPDTAKKQPAPPGGAGVLARQFAGAKPALVPGLSLALTYFGYVALTSFAVIALSERSISGGATVISVYALSLVLARLAVGPFTGRLRTGVRITMSIVLEALGLILLAVAHTLPLAILGATLMGIGLAETYPSLGDRVLKATDDSRRGAAVATYGAFIQIGISAGGPLLGTAADSTGYTSMFLLAAACALAGLAIDAMHQMRARAI